MATPEFSTPSRRMRSAARAERERLLRQVAVHEERLAELQREVARRQTLVRDLRMQLSLLAQLAHEDETSPFPVTPRHLQPVREADEPVPERGYLRGADIRVVAVRLLISQENPSRTIHYGD